MKEKLLLILLLLFFVGLSGAKPTNSYFSSIVTIGSSTFSTSCWEKPSIPDLIYPTNNYQAFSGSEWLANPYMDSNSTNCSKGAIVYEYESYRDSGLSTLIYRSALLTTSTIPAPGTPDGTYYWRVRAFDGNSWSNWSSVWLLTVDRAQTFISLQSVNPKFENNVFEPENLLQHPLQLNPLHQKNQQLHRVQQL
jgi:hypothetical protein